MTDFQERFSKNTIHDHLSTINTKIDELQDAATEDMLERGLSRFFKCYDIFNQNLVNIDPELVTANTLNTLNSQLKNLRQHVELYIQTADADPLNQAMDEVLDCLHLLPQYKDSSIDHSKILESLRNRAEAILAQLTDSTKESISLSEKLLQRSQLIESEIEKHEKAFESQKGRIDELITSQQTTFNTAMQQHTESISNKLSEVDNEIGALLGAKAEIADGQFATYKEEAQSQIDALKDQLNRAKKIVGLIGNTGMAGHYQIIANEERSKADMFKWLAVVFFIVLAAIAIIIVWQVKNEDFSWQLMLFRFTISFSLLLPAVYCTRVSSKHRTAEVKYRQIELELASISPFLERLPEEKSQEIIAKLADEYFGNHSTMLEESHPPEIEMLSLSGIDSLIRSFAKLNKP